MNTENKTPEPPEYRPAYISDSAPPYRFRDQIPAILVTVILVSVIGAWIFGRSASRQEAALAPLREQNDALRAQADENRRQMEATTQLLRSAIARHEGELFKTDEEVQKINGDRINALADAIAQKVAPALPARQTPEELARAEDAQVEKISTRTAEKLQPSLGELAQSQKGVNRQVVAQYDTRIQQLNSKVQETQAAAQDALKLSHEISSLYLDSYRYQGALVRIFAFPGEVIRDTATGNIFTANHDRTKAQKDLDKKMREIEDRLNQIEQSQPSGGAPLATN